MTSKKPQLWIPKTTYINRQLKPTYRDVSVSIHPVSAHSVTVSIHPVWPFSVVPNPNQPTFAQTPPVPNTVRTFEPIIVSQVEMTPSPAPEPTSEQAKMLGRQTTLDFMKNNCV